MNTKKIWMFAILFGFAMSVLLYLVTSNNGDNGETVRATNSLEEVEEETSPYEEAVTSIVIAEGKRAISIAVNDVQSVSGFVRPGSFVDLIAVLPMPLDEETSSQLMLENVKVLAVGKTLVDVEGENQEPYQMVTLEVSPQEGAALAFAKEIGVFTLILRGAEDQGPSPKVIISLEQLLKGKMPK